MEERIARAVEAAMAGATGSAAGPSVIHSLFVPGRLCLAGEHSDWAAAGRNATHDGAAIAVCTTLGLTARACRTADGRLRFRTCRQRRPSAVPHAEGTTTTIASATGTPVEADSECDGVHEAHNYLDVALHPAALRRVAAAGGWWSYVCGTAAAFLEAAEAAAQPPGSAGGGEPDPAVVALSARPLVPGAGAVIDVVHEDLPVAVGLSSSAAVCILTARALSLTLVEWPAASMAVVPPSPAPPGAAAPSPPPVVSPDSVPLSRAGRVALGRPGPLGSAAEMELAYRGERLTPSQCGRLDQVCALGPGAAALLRFKCGAGGGALEMSAVDIGRQAEGPAAAPGGVEMGAATESAADAADGGGIAVVLADLRGRKDTTRILQALRAAHDDRRNQPLIDALGRLNAASVEQVRLAIADGGDSAASAGEQGACAGAAHPRARRLGAALGAAQRLFDAAVVPHCEEQLRAPLLRAVLSSKAAADFGVGGKGVGSQGDGCAQLVARDVAAASAMAEALEVECGCATYVLEL